MKAAIATQPSGQGHETSFAQVLGSMLGVPLERVDIITGDTIVAALRERRVRNVGMPATSDAVWRAIRFG